MQDIDRRTRAFLGATFGHQMAALTEVQRNDLVFTIGTLALRLGDSEESIETALAWLEGCAREADLAAADAEGWAAETIRRFEESELVSHEASVIDRLAEDARRRIRG